MPPRTSPPRWALRSYNPRTASAARVSARTTSEEPGAATHSPRKLGWGRKPGPVSPLGPRTAGHRHPTALKECIHRMLSRQEEIIRTPRRAKPRAPVRESPTDRPGKTGNLSWTPKRTACFHVSRAARFMSPPASHTHRRRGAHPGRPHAQLPAPIASSRKDPRARPGRPAARTARDPHTPPVPLHPSPPRSPFR